MNKLVKEKWFSNYVIREIPTLSERNIAVTGTTTGTGFYVVIAAIRKNAKAVFVLNRASNRVTAMMDRFEEEKKNFESQTVIIPIDCNLGSFESVHNAVKNLKEEIAARKLPGIDTLVNNAGIGGIPLPITSDGYHSQIQINHLSHFLLVDLLKPVLEKSAEFRKTPSRIVNVSSGFRAIEKFNQKAYEPSTKKMGKENLYGQSKLAAAMMSFEFNRRNDATRIFSCVADPGVAATDFFEQRPDDTPKTGCTEAMILALINHFGVKQSASDGAMPLVAAAFRDDIHPGDYLAPKGFQALYGEPRKIIDAGKPVWTFYKEANVLDAKMGKELWELSQKATSIQQQKR